MNSVDCAIKLNMSDNPILDGLVWDRSAGSLLYNGVRYLLIRPETITGFQKANTGLGASELNDILFAGGFAGGSLSTQKYQALHNFSNLEVIEFMMNMGAQIGWGSFSLSHYDPALKHLGVVVKHSPFAQAYGKSSQSVCHLIRGVLAGMASILFGENCTADEVECEAKGDNCCRFVMAGRDR